MFSINTKFPYSPWVSVKATLSDTREKNRRLVLDIAYLEGATTRADVARITGLTRATASNIVRELTEDGYLADVGTVESTGGKPPTLFEFRPGARAIVTLDLSQQPFVGAVHDLRGTVLDRTTSDRPELRGTEAIDEARRLALELAAGVVAPVLGIGVGAPGIIDAAGRVHTSANLGWSDVPLAAILGSTTKLPTHVDNDTAVAALAEYASYDPDVDNLILIEIGEGIGAGIVLNSQIHRGDGSAAGEIGHLVARPGGDRCTCGKRGCLETVAGVPAILATAGVGAVAELDPLNPAHVTAVRKAAGHIGRVLASAIGVLDVHHIVVAGPLGELADHVIEPVRKKIRKHILRAVADDINVTWTKHTDDIVLIGAARNVLSHELGILR